MSTDTVVGRRLDRKRLTRVRESVVAVLFGDRVGLALFLGCACLFALFWRTTILITDTYTLANGLYSLSNGNVFLTEAVYGPSLDTPGTEYYRGNPIARNYGAIVLSLPFWALLEGLGAVVDLRIGIVALWSLGLLAFVVTLGRHLDSETVVAGGSVLVLAVFGLNVALARPLDSASTHLYALQLFHLTVAAFAPVLLYRLVRRMHTSRVGTLTAVTFTLGTPLALWATVPKRHVLTATVVVGLAYCLYRSRMPTDGVLVRRPATFRALAYALVGLYAWVHAPEALLLAVVLALVDVPTAPENSPRTLLLVAVAFGLSLVPFFVTNALVAGSPIRPPRLLAVAGSGGGSGSTGTAAAGSGSGATSTGILTVLAPLFTAIEPVVEPLLLLGGELLVGAQAIVSQPSELYHALVRSGYTAGTVDLSNEEAVNLSLLESAPVLLALAGVVASLRGRRRRPSIPSRILSGPRVVDIFAILLLLGVTLQYASRLPIHAQITVRYLFPLYPLGIYLLIRLPVLRATLAENYRLFAWTVAGSIAVGGQLVVVVVALTTNGLGEAFQFHALLSLAVAIPLGVWAVAGSSDGWSGRVGAVLLGVTTALPALFGLLTAVEYYALGDTHALPMVRALGELLPLL